MEHLPEVRRPAGLARTSRDTAQAVERALGRGVAKAAEVEAAAFVTETGLMNAAKLTGTEELLTRIAPLGEARYQSLVDSFTLVANRKILETG